jgi:hypothetical protein
VCQKNIAVNKYLNALTCAAPADIFTRHRWLLGAGHGFFSSL